jgi:hypothetical protein
LPLVAVSFGIDEPCGRLLELLPYLLKCRL